MSTDVLEIEKMGTVARLTLNRPNQFNALNTELRRALRVAVLQLEDDDAIRIVILRGKGRGFCAGADLSDGIELPVSVGLDEEYKPIITGVAQSNKIWIAQVHGSAAGIGAALALNCDLLSIAGDANIYMAFAAIGLIPDGGNTQLLVKAMGYRRALQAVLEGEKISAQRCFDYGMANRIVAAQDQDADTLAWAEKLATGAPLAMAAAKRLLRQADALSLSEAFDAEGLEQDPLTQSNDFKEAVEAFFRKEKPVFHGN